MLDRLTHLDWVQAYALPWSINLLLAITTFILGHWLARGLVAVARKLLSRARLDSILSDFILAILQGVLQLVVVIAALNRLGIDTTSLVALIGAAGLAVGLALQDALKNFAAGVMLILFRPFKAGDYVDAGGVSGVVERIKLFSSTLRTADNREITLPNGAIYSGVITNYSARPTRRIDLLLRVSYDDDLRAVKAAIARVLQEEPRLLPSPEAFIGVAELGEYCISLHVRPWVATVDHFATSCALKERLRLAFDEHGFSIPYPQHQQRLLHAGEVPR